MNQIILYTTDGCHLCEQAIGMFYYAKQQRMIPLTTELKLTDIISDDSLTATYGERIPVFKKVASGEELGWPIEFDNLVNWLKTEVDKQ